MKRKINKCEKKAFLLLTGWNGRAVEVPLDLHGGVAERTDLGLEVDPLALVDRLVAQRSQEGRRAEPLDHLIILGH